MSRWSSYGQRDTKPVVDGDAAFSKLEMKHDRALLEEGSLFRSENKRLRTGRADTRPGTDIPDFCNLAKFSSSFVGSGLYSNPAKDERLFIAQPGGHAVW